MSKQTPYLGVIEGFFGSSWCWSARSSYASFLRTQGYSFYVYAPKEDPYLRKQWRDIIPDSRLEELTNVARTFRSYQLDFGVGLSPFEAYRDYGRDKKIALQQKVRVLNTFAPEILCVLFDDMRGDLPGLAASQVKLLGDIREVSSAKRIIFCPTYYSSDPIIEKVFGPMPEGYLETLGRDLDPTIDIFWTGPRVCSTEFPRLHLEEVATRLQRKPFLWDNYPVNDSRKMSPFLHLRAFENRGPELVELLSGHAVNPAKQAYLSKIPLASLPLSYSQGAAYNPSDAFDICIKNVCGGEIGEAIAKDLTLFQDVGLEALSEDQKQVLLQRYRKFGEDSFAREILGWLEGRYVFDPACLTE